MSNLFVYGGIFRLKAYFPFVPLIYQEVFEAYLIFFLNDEVFRCLPECCTWMCGEPDYVIAYKEIRQIGPDIIVVDIC